jgi:thiol-disulfide isomerase/thioredoxin
MKLVLFAIAVLGAFFFWQKHKEGNARAIAYTAAAAKQSDPCAGKKFCATIYVAPWCPACKAELPRFRNYLSKAHLNRDYGLKIVVGRGQKPEDNEAMARQLGAGAVVDPDGKIFNDLRVQQFPSFFILDGEKSVVLSDNEAFQWIHQKF